MGIHPLALTHGLSREQIELAVENAETTVAIDNLPTRILILAFGDDGQLLEATGVIRDEDVLFVHAGPARAGYKALLDTTGAPPSIHQRPAAPETTDTQRYSVDGVELTDGLIADLAERAQTGHDIDTLKIRLRPGRPAPLSVGDVIRVELTPALYSACASRADDEGVPVHDVMRRALRRHLQLESL
jgi:hypothetical protein